MNIKNHVTADLYSASKTLNISRSSLTSGLDFAQGFVKLHPDR